MESKGKKKKIGGLDRSLELPGLLLWLTSFAFF